MRKILILSLTIVSALMGCKTTPPEEAAAPASGAEAEVLAVAEQWKQAVVAKNLDQLMSVYSDRFSNPDVGDKAGLRSYFDEASSAGALDGMIVDLTEAKAAITGSQATVAQIRITNSSSQLVYELDCAVENGHWRVIGSKSAPM